MSGELLDEHGYPTEAQLDRLEHWDGTFWEAFEFIDALWLGGIGRDRVRDRLGEEVTEYRLVTGGWSGCERVHAALTRTMIEFICWQESHRGGLYVYHLRDAQRDWKFSQMSLRPPRVGLYGLDWTPSGS